MEPNIVKCNNCNIVINELLAFIQNKMDVMASISLTRICSSAFSEEEIVTAKNLLFDSVKSTKRKIQRKKEGKSQRDLEDIVGLMRQIDPDEIPTFVAKNLSKLPPVTFDHVDVTRLLKDILVLQQDMIEIKENYAKKEEINSLKMDLVSKTIKENNNCLKGSMTVRTCGAERSPLANNIVEHLSVTNTLKQGKCQVTSDMLDKKSDSPLSLSIITEQEKEGSSRKFIQEGNKTEKRVTALPSDKETNANIVTHPLYKSYAQTVNEEGEWKSKQPDEQWKLVQRKRYQNRFISSKGEASVDPEGKFKAADCDETPVPINNFRGVERFTAI